MIVEATAVASASLSPDNKGRAKKMEEAMTVAVMKAYNMGITDPTQIKSMIQDAREKTLKL